MGEAILIIEDDRLLRLTITAFLEDCGYRVMEAEDGRDGLALVETAAPALVVTDLRMPNVDGFAVIATLQRSHPELPVIAITGTGDTGAVEEALHLGAVACLHKPITDMRVLDEAIAAAVRYRQSGT